MKPDSDVYYKYSSEIIDPEEYNDHIHYQWSDINCIWEPMFRRNPETNKVERYEDDDVSFPARLKFAVPLPDGKIFFIWEAEVDPNKEY